MLVVGDRPGRVESRTLMPVIAAQRIARSTEAPKGDCERFLPKNQAQIITQGVPRVHGRVP